MSSRAHGKFSGRRLLVLGCGYVGAAVAERLQLDGAIVAALTRNAATAAVLRAGGIETVVADLADDAWHGSFTVAPDFVVNTVSSGGGGVQGYRHSYLLGMESMLRWARKVGGVGTVVYTSSTSVYPQGAGERVDETSSVSGSTELASVLVETERALMENAGACGRWFILRLAGIYGPGRHSLLEQVRSGVVSGRGEHHLNLAHRNDIVTAVRASLGAPPALGNEVFNVADDGPAPKREVAAWLANALGVPAPTFTGMAAAGRRSVTPDRLVANDKLKRVLGWRPLFPTFREGYQAIIASPAP